MSFLRKRPAIQVLLSERVRPGEVLDVEVILDAERALRVNGATCVLHGRVATHFMRQNRVWRDERTYVHEEATLSEAGVLQQGGTRYSVAFQLPSELPPPHGRPRSRNH